MFNGSALHILKYNSVTILLFGLVVSVGLMGTNWSYFFIASLIAMLPVMLLLTLVLSWSNRFAFDDERGAFMKPGGRRIPYHRVKKIHICDRGRVIDVFVRQGWMHMTTLVEAVPAGQAQRLRDALDERFPERVHARSRWIFIVPVAAILAVLVLLLIATHVFLYHRHPQLHASPQPIERDQQKQGVRPPVEFIEEIGFTPPAGYRYIGEDQGELYFEDKALKQRLKVVGGIQRTLLREQALLFRYAMGVRNHADLLDLSYRARFGAVPLFLRSLDLAGLDQVALFEIVSPLRGYISQGRREKIEETHIVITGEHSDQEVHFFFSGPKRLSEKTLQRFVAGIQQIQFPGT